MILLLVSLVLATSVEMLLRRSIKRSSTMKARIDAALSLIRVLESAIASDVLTRDQALVFFHLWDADQENPDKDGVQCACGSLLLHCDMDVVLVESIRHGVKYCDVAEVET